MKVEIGDFRSCQPMIFAQFNQEQQHETTQAPTQSSDAKSTGPWNDGTSTPSPKFSANQEKHIAGHVVANATRHALPNAPRHSQALKPTDANQTQVKLRPLASRPEGTLFPLAMWSWVKHVCFW